MGHHLAVSGGQWSLSIEPDPQENSDTIKDNNIETFMIIIDDVTRSAIWVWTFNNAVGRDIVEK